MATTGISQDALLGMLTTTREHVATIDFDQTFKHPQYPLLNFMLERRRVHTGGKYVRWNIRTDESGNARGTKPYQNDSINITDQQVEGQARVRYADTHWGIDDREEVLNEGPEQVVNLMRDREKASLESMANRFERWSADTPTNASDEKSPIGIPGQVCMGPAGSFEAGFVGQTLRYSNGSDTTTTIYNIDRSTSERLRNWASLYTTINSSFVKKFSEALHMVMANPPAMLRGLDALAKSPMVGFAPLDAVLQLEDFAEKKNSGAGNEVSTVDGVVTVKGVPILHAPTLDKTSSSDTHVVRAYEPIYVLNKSQWAFYTLSDHWDRAMMRKNANNHHLVEEWRDYGYVPVGFNPRYIGFVMHKQISA